MSLMPDEKDKQYEKVIQEMHGVYTNYLELIGTDITRIIESSISYPEKISMLTNYLKEKKLFKPVTDTITQSDSIPSPDKDPAQIDLYEAINQIENEQGTGSNK